MKLAWRSVRIKGAVPRVRGGAIARIEFATDAHGDQSGFRLARCSKRARRSYIEGRTYRRGRRRGAISKGDDAEPVGILVIVNKDPKRQLRPYGADRLEAGGFERIAAAIQVPLEGSW